MVMHFTGILSGIFRKILAKIGSTNPATVFFLQTFHICLLNPESMSIASGVPGGIPGDYCYKFYDECLLNS